MNITIHDNPRKFLNILENDFSFPYKNELMIGLVSTLIKDYSHYQTQPILLTINEKEIVILASFLTPPWPILLYTESIPSTSSLSILIDYLEKKKIKISGINAKTDLSSLFSKHWCIRNKCVAEKKMMMSLYTLKKINKIKVSPGSFIKANQHHFHLIYEWAILFHKELNLQYENEQYIKKHLKYNIESGNAFLWVDNEPVCMVFRERAHQKGFSIGYVYTPYQLRSKGYATNLVYNICNTSFKEGFRYASLFADLQNPISNHIYKKIGFKEEIEYQIIDFHYR